MNLEASHVIRDVDALEALYGQPLEASIVKEVDYIHPDYRVLIEASPFAVLATAGADGLDASPRGDPAGFVVVADEKTLLLPDRRGNNRADSLRNIVADGRVGLLFLIPGAGETLRVNGTAVLSTDPALLQRFIKDQLRVRSSSLRCRRCTSSAAGPSSAASCGTRTSTWFDQRFQAPGRCCQTSASAGSAASSTTGSSQRWCRRRCTSLGWQNLRQSCVTIQRAAGH